MAQCNEIWRWNGCSPELVHSQDLIIREYCAVYLLNHTTQLLPQLTALIGLCITMVAFLFLH